MTLTPETATEAHARLTAAGTPERAAHQIRIELRAIQPYTDRALSRVLAVLDYIASRPEASRERLTATLATLAGQSQTHVVYPDGTTDGREA